METKLHAGLERKLKSVSPRPPGADERHSLFMPPRWGTAAIVEQIGWIIDLTQEVRVAGVRDVQQLHIRVLHTVEYTLCLPAAGWSRERPGTQAASDHALDGGAGETGEVRQGELLLEQQRL